MKITGFLNTMFRPQKNLKKTRTKLCPTLNLPFLLYGSETWTIKARQKNNSGRDEMYEQISRIRLDRLQNKYTNYKGIKTNTNS